MVMNWVPKKRRDDAEMDITPMIDMTFLLLIFFLVSSRMDAGAEVKLPLAKNGVAITTKNSAVVSVKSLGADAVDVFLGEKMTSETRLASTAPEDLEEGVQAFVSAQMSRGKDQVLIRASRDVKHRFVDRILKAIGTVEGASAYVAVLEES